MSIDYVYFFDRVWGKPVRNLQEKISMIKNKLPDTNLTLSDFHYDLPESYIAQTPVEPRDLSRMMIVDRNAPAGKVEHRVFRDIID